MGSILTTERTLMFMDKAEIVSVDFDIASHWAAKYINGNPAYKWVVSKYVEADNPNSNRQMWSLADLESNHSTLHHAPLNLLHQQSDIVGTYVGSDVIYSKDGSANPHVESVAAFWRHYFPNELAAMEKFHKEGTLFSSMECVSETVTFIAADGRSEEFPYEGPRHPSYGDWNKDSTAARRLNKPHFVGGALIFPPVRPGWGGASVQELSEFIKDHEQEAEFAYHTFKKGAPHANPDVWEELMLHVISYAKAHRE